MPALEQLARDVFGARTTVDADGAVEGHASLFGVVDSARDMMLPGAFARSLALRGVRRIPMLFQHDPSEPIGIWDELVEDARGLRARGRLIPDVQRAREVLALVRAGALDGLSIGFRTTRARVDPVTRVRKLSDVELWEISVVTFPLLDGARVGAVKHVARIERERNPGPVVPAARPAPGFASLNPGYGRHRHPILAAPARIFPPGRIVRIAARAKYSPDQPRVPAGNPDGGQWTGSSGQTAAPMRLAGEWPSNEPPEIPKERPPTAQERNKIVKDVARRLGRGAVVAAVIFEAARWLNEYRAEIVASLDPPKSLDELRDAVTTPRAGYDKHHIVEQTPAGQDGYPRSMIEAPDNLVRIPRLKHREINGWYQTPNKDFGGLSPREYLRGRAWDERTQVGLRALRNTGVLKP
jgi:Escherichia/Staphylococcus phage prohead protease